MQIGILHSKTACRTDAEISPFLPRLLLLEINLLSFWFCWFRTFCN